MTYIKLIYFRMNCITNLIFYKTQKKVSENKIDLILNVQI